MMVWCAVAHYVGDWYRTFAQLAGVPEEAIFDQRAKAASLPPLDSLDVWPMLSGANATSPRVEIPLSTLPGLNGGWNGLGLPEHDEPGSFRDPNYFSGGEGLIVGEWKIVTGWQPIGPFGSGHTPSCNNNTAMQNDGVGWGKEGGNPPGTPASAKGWGRYGVNCDCGAGCLFHLPSVRLPLSLPRPRGLGLAGSRHGPFRQLLFFAATNKHALLVAC